MLGSRIPLIKSDFSHFLNQTLRNFQNKVKFFNNSVTDRKRLTDTFQKHSEHLSIKDSIKQLIK